MKVENNKHQIVYFSWFSNRISSIQKTLKCLFAQSYNRVWRSSVTRFVWAMHTKLFIRYDTWFTGHK